MIKTLSRLLIFILLSSSPVAFAKLYIYVGPDGTRWISDQPMTDPGFTLLRDYRPSYMRGSSRLVCGKPGASLMRQRLNNYAHVISRYASRYDVDEALVKAVIHAESCYDANAVSRAGAIGLMQLMPATAKRYGVNNSYNPSQNIRGGIRYLSDLFKMFNNNHRLVLAAYNAGENNVRKYGGIPPFPETQNYVPKVLRFYKYYRKTL